MERQEPEADYESPAGHSRARRGLSLIFVSIFVIAVTGLAFVHPTIGQSARAVKPAAPATYQLSAVDFVTPTTGWFAATFDSGRFVLLPTEEGGQAGKW